MIFQYHNQSQLKTLPFNNNNSNTKISHIDSLINNNNNNNDNNDQDIKLLTNGTPTEEIVNNNTS
jgi:hypothetical protein